MKSAKWYAGCGYVPFFKDRRVTQNPRGHRPDNTCQIAFIIAPWMLFSYTHKGQGTRVSRLKRDQVRDKCLLHAHVSPNGCFLYRWYQCNIMRDCHSGLAVEHG